MKLWKIASISIVFRVVGLTVRPGGCGVTVAHSCVGMSITTQSGSACLIVKPIEDKGLIA